MPVQSAKVELGTLLLAWLEKHDLTWVEAVCCLLEHAHQWQNYVLRAERHPDDPTGEKKADEA
jgi:hypothetical protein